MSRRPSIGHERPLPGRSAMTPNPIRGQPARSRGQHPGAIEFDGTPEDTCSATNQEQEGSMKRRTFIACLAAFAVGALTPAAMSPSGSMPTTGSGSAAALFTPAVGQAVFVSASSTPPTEAECYAVGIP